MICEAMKIDGGNLNAWYCLKAAHLKGYILYSYFLHKIIWKRQNHGDSKKISGYEKLGGRVK